MSAPSKYAENQFLSATDGSYLLMSEVLADTLARATAAVGTNAAFTSVLANLNFAAAGWNSGETAIANAEAAQPAATLALEDKLASLTRKPSIDVSSILETWDNIIRSQVAYQGTTYTFLLPQGRETVTRGTHEQQIDALRDLGTRLAAQTTKPDLVTLGTTVTTFATQARTLRTAQTGAKNNVETAYTNQEPRRLQCANALYAFHEKAWQVEC
jgi:hypothetical protein